MTDKDSSTAMKQQTKTQLPVCLGLEVLPHSYHFFFSCNSESFTLGHGMHINPHRVTSTSCCHFSIMPTGQYSYWSPFSFGGVTSTSFLLSFQYYALWTIQLVSFLLVLLVYVLCLLRQLVQNLDIYYKNLIIFTGTKEEYGLLLCAVCNPYFLPQAFQCSCRYQQIEEQLLATLHLFLPAFKIEMVTPNPLLFVSLQHAEMVCIFYAHQFFFLHILQTLGSCLSTRTIDQLQPQSQNQPQPLPQTMRTASLRGKLVTTFRISLAVV